MANKPYRRGSFRGKGKYSNWQRIPFETDLPLLALGAGALVLADLMPANFSQGYRVVSVEATWDLRTHSAGDGPIRVGWSHGDYSGSEVDEWTEVSFTDRGDMIAQERASRRIRQVGKFRGLLTDEVLNDGRLIKTRLNWHFPEGHQLSIWAKNRSESTFTTGSVVVVDGVLNGFWQD